MKKISSLSLFIILNVFNWTFGQSSFYAKYIDSFKDYKSKEVINAGFIVQTQDQMTKKEALSFVYHGDTSQLFCKQKIFNMETEKIEGISNELYLPNKCLRIDMGKYFLITYSFFKCQNSNTPLSILLMLTIVSKNYESMDSLIIYKGNDFDSYLTGLINPTNGRIFVYGTLNDQNENHALIYNINPSKLKFEKLNEDIFVGNIDNLKEIIEVLGWNDKFYNK